MAHETRFRLSHTDEGYELTIIAYSQALRCMVTIPAGTYETVDLLFAAYPEVLLASEEAR